MGDMSPQMAGGFLACKLVICS